MTPIDAIVAARCWGIIDPRVVSALAHENQAGRWRRTCAVGDRARTVGWPNETITLNASRDATLRALRRLEGGDFTPKGRRDAGKRKAATAAAYKRQRAIVNARVWDGEPSVSIYDE